MELTIFYHLYVQNYELMYFCMTYTYMYADGMLSSNCVKYILK